jgi:hypothetical protein
MLAGSAGSSEYSALSRQRLGRWRRTEGFTVALRLWYLERYVSGNALDDDMLRAVPAVRFGPEPL